MRSPVLLAAIVLASGCASPPLAPELGIAPDGPRTADDLTLEIGEDPEFSGTYEVRWSVDGAPVDALDDARSVPADRTARDQVWAVAVTAVDDKDQRSATTETMVTIENTPPSASVSFSPTAPGTEDDVVAAPVGEDVDGDTLSFAVTWESGGGTIVEGTTLAAADTVKGERWVLTVVPSDGTADGEAITEVVDIGNSPPAVDTVVLAPTPATESTVLTATPTGSDPDGDAITWSYAWTVNGIAAPETGDSLTGTAFDKGDVVVVTVTANDGSVDGPSLTSDAVTIDNTAPSLTGAVVTPDPATETSVLGCSPVGWTDADGDLLGVEISWEVEGVSVSTSPTLTGADFSRDQEVVCVLTPFDGEDLGAEVRSTPLSIRNTPPSLAGVAADVTAIYTADTITARVSGGTDIDGDSLSYAFAWTVDGATVRSITTTETVDSLDGSYFAKDQVVGLSVTPSDGDADGAAVVMSAITVLNSIPTMTSVTISPSTLRTDSVAAAIGVASDADGDALTYTYAWTVDDGSGAAAVGTASSLDGSVHFDRDDEVAVSLRASDGSDTSAPMASAGVTVENSPPKPPIIELTGTPSYGEDLTCTITNPASDLDGDTITDVIFRWTRDGIAYTGATTSGSTSTVPASAVADGEVWVCQVTASDGFETSAPVTASQTVAMYESCDALLTADSTRKGKNGIYRIDPSGSGSFEVSCDMSYDGGGWTQVIRADRVSIEASDPPDFRYNASVWTSDGYGGPGDKNHVSEVWFDSPGFTELRLREDSTEYVETASTTGDLSGWNKSTGTTKLNQSTGSSYGPYGGRVFRGYVSAICNSGNASTSWGRGLGPVRSCQHTYGTIYYEFSNYGLSFDTMELWIR